MGGARREQERRGRRNDEDGQLVKWGENGVVALGAASLSGLCPAFVLPISTPYGQNPDKMGMDLGSCGGVSLMLIDNRFQK